MALASTNTTSTKMVVMMKPHALRLALPFGYPLHDKVRHLQPGVLDEPPAHHREHDMAHEIVNWPGYTAR